MKLMSPLPIEPNTSDFRLIDRAYVTRSGTTVSGERFYRGNDSVGGLQADWRRVRRRRAPGRVPSYTFGRMLQFSMNGILSYSYMPMYVLLLSAAGFLVAGTLYGGLVLYLRFVTGEVIPGLTSILLLMVIIGAAQLLATCVAAVYAYKA